VVDVPQQLEWEARQRPKMAIAAALAGLLTFAGSVYVQMNLQDPPRAWLVDSLARLESGDAIGPHPSLRIPFFDFVADNISTLIVSAALSAVGLLLLGVVMFFLARATQARASTLPKIAPRLPLIGGAALGLGLVLSALGTGELYDRLVAARTVDATQNPDGGGLLFTGQSINLAGALALGVGMVLVCLHAMRAGLLTRFMGVLGILVGAIIGFSPFLGSGFSPVQMFWLLALALLLSGRWPGGEPPAWRSGTAMPWPSAAAVREARAGGPAASAPAAPREPKAPKPERSTSGPSPATSAKKKRKRRG
jgi:hypothetical protein